MSEITLPKLARELAQWAARTPDSIPPANHRKAFPEDGINQFQILSDFKHRPSSEGLSLTRHPDHRHTMNPTVLAWLEHPIPRSRIMTKTIERANEKLAERDGSPLPDGLTPHSLRRTFISLLLAIGEEVPT